jgi:catechol 2,3-dioxygenase-like lactoylglutathione lyase family enzyme
MLGVLATFSGFSVNDMAKAKAFYTETLGITLSDESMGLQFELPGNAKLFIYEKSDHTAATSTVLNFVVAHIDETVDELANKGVVFEKYDSMPGAQDERGILRGIAAQRGPDIAWFKDPAGNILSILQES